MEFVRLGISNLLISRVAFGSKRLLEKESEDAAVLVRKAYESGINFFDTSRNTPDAEKVLGDALYDIRKNVILGTATSAQNGHDVRNDLEESLMSLHCDWVELYQYEADSFVPKPGDSDNIYNTLLDLKKHGKIKHIGIITTDFDLAMDAIKSELYDTIQFPLSMIAPEDYFILVKMCEERDVGFIAMQPLGGGLIDNIPLAFGFLHQFENVIPIWGAKNLQEMEQILYFNEHPPVIDEKFKADVERARSFFN